MFLATERLMVRRFRAEDVPAFAAYRSDPEVARYQSCDAPYPLEQAAELVQEFATGDPLAPGWFQYAVDLGGVLIGDIGINLHDNLMQADLGFTLAPGYQGQGYATEAVGALIGYLFTERHLHRISADCDARNHASARLLERLEFRQEGMRIANSWFKGEWTDDLLFGLLRSECLLRSEWKG